MFYLYNVSLRPNALHDRLSIFEDTGCVASRAAKIRGGQC